MIQTFPLAGLRIQSTRFGAVEPRATAAGGGRAVSAEVLAQTQRDECKCEDPRHMAALGLSPLRVGTPVFQLVELGSGCTTGRWVCSRLDRVRRAYGK